MILAGIYTGNIKHICSKENNALWGCYSEASKPRWNLPCINCYGNKGDLTCPICKGQGIEPMTKCPNSVNTNSMNKIFTAFIQLENYKVMPFNGSLLDQSSCFVKAISMIPPMINAWGVANAEDKKKIQDIIKRRK